MSLWLMFSIAAAVFFVGTLLFTQIGKRIDSAAAQCLAPAVGGSAAAAVCWSLFARQLTQATLLPHMLLCFTLLLALGAAVCLWRQRKIDTVVGAARPWRPVRLRGALALSLMAAQWLLCAGVLLAFGHAQHMTAALSLGLFATNYLLGLFPLAIILLAFCKARLGERML